LEDYINTSKLPLKKGITKNYLSLTPFNMSWRNYTQWIGKLKRRQKEQKYLIRYMDGYRLCNSENVIKKLAGPFFTQPIKYDYDCNINGQ
jgi:hypothetical protein